MRNLITAFASALPTEGIPNEIVYMPEGEHRITPFVDGKAKAITVEIVVSGDLINTAAEGQAADLGGIWDDEAFLSYSQETADLKALNFARTFNWTAAGGSGPNGISSFTYDQDEIDSRVVRARQYTDEKVVAAGAGYYFSNVLS